MRRGDVVEIVFVEIIVEWRAGAEQLEMVLGAGQRRQIEEFQQIDRQLALDDVDVVEDRFHRVVRKAEDVAGIGDDPLGAPGKEHLAIFVHAVLLLLSLQEVIGVDVFEPDKNALAAGARCDWADITLANR